MTTQIDYREAAARAAAAQWLTGLCRTGLTDAKNTLADHLEPGERMRATLDGKQVGTISMSDPKPTTALKITDEKAFTKWVAHHHPEAIIPAVAPWFSAAANIAALVAEAAGELPDGVEEIDTTRDPIITVRVSEEQARNLEILTVQIPVTRLIEGPTEDDDADDTETGEAA